jgi:hypothetical protein
MARATARRAKGTILRDIVRSTADYEAWSASCIAIVKPDLERKHEQMRLDPFAFFRGTFYRWAELWPRVCPDLEAGPHLLCVGDLHVENFGVWRDDEGRLVWGVNDFDEAYEAAATVDLVRLLASIMLARDTSNIRMKDEAVAEALTKGWLRAMTRDAQPFVLGGSHRWLHRLAVSKLKDPRPFWKKLNRAAPAGAAEAEAGGPRAKAALPEGVEGVTLIHRIAGMGSLGHPRVVALGQWLGGEVAREAKALTPSAWLWTRGEKAEGAPFRYEDILHQAIRCPDPTLSVADGWLTRRLAPDGSRVELSDLPNKRDDEKMFTAMGREIGNIHRRAPNAVDAVAFVKALPKGRLLGAARDMLGALQTDFERFKAG